MSLPIWKSIGSRRNIVIFETLYWVLSDIDKLLLRESEREREREREREGERERTHRQSNKKQRSHIIIAYCSTDVLQEIQG